MTRHAEQEARLLAADARRRRAMIEVDVNALRDLLAESLVWTHSSGKSEDREAVIATIAGGGVVYQHLELTESLVRPYGNLLLHHGVIEGKVTKDGADKALRNRFLSVWDASDGHFRMVAWQSTGL